MPPQSPSIQSFFGTKSTNRSNVPSSSSPPFSDGFSEEEINAALHPEMNQPWNPPHDYEEVEISALEAGPGAVTFMGRVVNFFDQVTPSKRPRAAKGCVKVIVKDDTGALTVRLWYAQIEYKLRLGHLVTVWTTHISHGEAGALAPTSAPYFTSIFPERDRSCHLMVHEASDDGVLCKTPPGYREGASLPGLMPLRNFFEGGHEVPDAKVLVCVKSIGAKKRYTNKKGTPVELIGVGLFDDTADASLTLWGSATSSASPWEPSNTVLLLTNPGCRTDREGAISLTRNTHVEINPCIPDADWLRGFAQRLIKRQHVNPPFPTGVFDFDTAMNSDIRVLFTLADIDEFARSAPQEKFVGYLSMLITELNLASLQRRTRLTCAECCGVPIFANASETTCKQCEKLVPLRINPRVLGPVIDETGTVTTGKLILAPTAWEMLFGLSTAGLVSSTSDELARIEQRLLFCRMTLVFGWVGDVEEEDCRGGRVGRLVVAEVML